MPNDIAMVKAIRLITGNKWNSHTATMFKYSDSLMLSDINRLQVGCFVYQAFHDHLPESFNNYFVTNHSIHRHLTRPYNDMRQLPCNSYVRVTCIENGSFYYSGNSTTPSKYFSLKTQKKFFRNSILRRGKMSVVFVPDSICCSIQFLLPIHYH